MTCIVGIEQNGKVYIGGDSAMSSKSEVVISAKPKVFIRDEFVFGTAGDVRMMQVLKYMTMPDAQNSDIGDEQYMVTVFMENIREEFKNAGIMLVENSVENIQYNYFLIGYRGRLYRVESNLQIISNNDGVMATGSGALVALGSLYSTKGKPKKRIKKALEVSAYLTPFIRAPFTILSL